MIRPPDSSDAPSERFLVVDDEDPVREVLLGYLGQMGCEASGVASVSEARMILEGRGADIVLVDIFVGSESGFALIEEFGDEAPDIVFVVISGAESPDTPVEALRLGSLGYLRKPTRLSAFRGEIERVRRKRERMLRQRDEHSTLRRELEGRTRDFLVEVGVNASLQKSLIQSLCRLTEFRDSETGIHLKRMADYCREIAKGMRRQPELNLDIDDRFINRLVTTAPLHDIGKAGIPDRILKKPGPLTAEEFEVMKKHTIIGWETLAEVGKASAQWTSELISMGQEICLFHHEQWDGGGYPQGIAGEMIPISARIVSLADFYDALTSTRVYRPYALTHGEICAMIREGRGRKFDPRAVDAFFDQEEEILKIRESADYESRSSGANAIS